MGAKIESPDPVLETMLPPLNTVRDAERRQKSGKHAEGEEFAAEERKHGTKQPNSNSSN
jgi:hypothetical protein